MTHSVNSSHTVLLISTPSLPYFSGKVHLVLYVKNLKKRGRQPQSEASGPYFPCTISLITVPIFSPFLFGSLDSCILFCFLSETGSLEGRGG